MERARAVSGQHKRSHSSSSLSLYDDGDESGGASRGGARDVEAQPPSKKTMMDSGAECRQASVPDDPTRVKFLSVFGSRKGDREEMQDRHLAADVLPLFAPSTSAPASQRASSSGVVIKQSALFALFDGHGGAAAAQFCHAHFASKLCAVFSKYIQPQSDWATIEKSMKKILVESYKSADDDFLVEARKHRPVLKDGTTATTLLLINNVVYCANVGDSKAVVCRMKPGEKPEFVAMPLTTEHSPTSFDERMRIQKAGGVVRDGRVMGVLEVSRSIGDGQFKAHGMSCLPDVRKLTLTQNDAFIILACDGLWKSFTSDEAIRFTLDRCRALATSEAPRTQPSASQPEPAKSGQEVWARIADELSADAVLRGCGDNVSVVLIVFTGNVARLLLLSPPTTTSSGAE